VEPSQIQYAWSPSASLLSGEFPPVSSESESIVGSVAGSGSGLSVLGLHSVSTSASVIASAAELIDPLEYTLEEKYKRLEIDLHFNVTPTYNVIDYYEQWLACEKAIANYQNHCNNHTWLKNKTNKEGIFMLLITKSMYHRANAVFTKITKLDQYAEMKAWLDSRGTEGSDAEIWGDAKSLYTLNNLVGWMEQYEALEALEKQEKEKERKKKAKGKAKASDTDKVSHKKKGSSSKK
jgi:hypothetical protein